ncbi:ABC transporter permease [Corynebacterium uterequi]|uniref:ABC-type dipeptide/oligopeptide/nickel transport system, permease component n=1 Tax=Corynebacterium uterequi TaxID=1072256 RepID=A0A0G3HE14_9CORY|nr:ABC transporter permease [Corynebacterium uterequi]AKK11606.1 ABC-type dipeptide/oligopeptide/nickel transport system, permease component [Corynebacterium uterequi]
MTRALIGGGILSVILATAVLAAVWTPYDPLHAVPAERLIAFSAEHPLGTDRFGRDILSRLMTGSQITLLVGTVAVALSAGIGTALGVVAGMRGGWPATVILRGSDILLAFPALLLAIVAGAVFGPSTLSAMIAIGIAGVPGFARVARAGTLGVMRQDYIAAARISGLSPVTIALRHVLPNISGVLIVQSTVAFALAVLAEAALSFLGLGTPAPEPSWGRMLYSAQASLGTHWHLAVWPGAAIAVTVLGANLLGDGLRDLLDPHRRQRA